jgi:hypothetical protein
MLDMEACDGAEGRMPGGTPSSGLNAAIPGPTWRSTQREQIEELPASFLGFRSGFDLHECAEWDSARRVGGPN